jgi:hypothetical protein
MFELLYRNGLWIFPPLFLLAAVLLVGSIRTIVKLGRSARIATLPLQEQQEVEFVEAGRVILCTEGPFLTGRFTRLRYEFTGADGVPLASHPTLFHAKSSTMSTVRMEMRSFLVERPGRHILRIEGLGAARADDAKHRIVLMRPHLLQAMGLTVGITLSGVALIASLVLFLIRLTERAAGA